MKKFMSCIWRIILSIILFSFPGCMTAQKTTSSLNTNNKSNPTADETALHSKDLNEHPELRMIYETHEITELPEGAGDKFVQLYILTRRKEYLPVGNRTFCVKFFYDYFTDIGYGEVLTEIKNTKGKNMVEKAITYADQTGKVKVLLSGFEAQKLANEGWDVGVLGEYYYDTAEKKYTVHYSVVQPSNVSYDEEGNVVPYYVTGLLTKRNDVNDRYGTGTFLAQAGIAVGLIDFRWAYNRKMNGIIQKDSKGNFRGGIIFIVFPRKRSNLLGFFNAPTYSLTINTDPGEASVFVDGILKGKGSTTIVFRNAGERIIEVTYPGYKDMQRRIMVGDFKEITINAQLQAYTGSLKITTIPPKAQIFINEKNAGISPCLISGLSLGEQAIRIRLPGYVSANSSISIEQETETELNIVLNQYEMIEIKGGSFDKPGRESLLINDFYMSKYEVTAEQYEEYCTKTSNPWPHVSVHSDRNKPITGVDWYDAVEYCNWLSIQEEYTPYYEIDKNTVDPYNTNTTDKKKWKVTPINDATGYRLPTSWEWEYAAQGGILSKGYVYAGGNDISDVAWYNENSKKQIQVVGQKSPNEIGLFDMSGNVWEWCRDWYNETTDELSTKEDTDQQDTGSSRVRKGGSAYNTYTKKGYFEIASTSFLPPDMGNYFTGFRIARIK